MNTPENGNTSPKNEFLTPGSWFSRIALFILSGLPILVVYVVLTFPVMGILSNLAEKAGERGTVEIPDNITFAVYTVFYIVPLFFFFFLRNIGLKTRVLHLTEEKFSLKAVFADAYRSFGWVDHLLYAVYSTLLLLPVGKGGDPFENPFTFICIQEMVFYTFSLPKIIGWLLAVLCFAAQYALCLIVASRYWDKNRLRRGN